MFNSCHFLVFSRVAYTTLQTYLNKVYTHKYLPPPVVNWPTPPCFWFCALSHAAAAGGLASSATLLEQKLELEISLLQKNTVSASLRTKIMAILTQEFTYHL